MTDWEDSIRGPGGIKYGVWMPRTKQNEPKKEKASEQPKAPANDWIKIKVVNDQDGTTISNVVLNLKTPDGNTEEHKTRISGMVESLGLQSGNCEVSCELKDATLDNTLAFIGVGDQPIGKNGSSSSKPGNLAAFKVATLEEHKVKKGETLESLAKSIGMTWQALAKFNWGTDKPDEINKHLARDVGCTKKTADGKNYLFDDADDPGIVYLPKKWTKNGLATMVVHTIRVQSLVKNRLESDFAVDYYGQLAEKMDERQFVMWSATIFGYDIPVEAYQALRKDLLEKMFTTPVIKLVPDKIEGKEASYNNKTKTINVYEPMAEEAINDNESAWKLFAALVEEVGHHVDNQLRTTYSTVGGDAKGEEGAKFAYNLIYWDYRKATKKEFAVYCRDGRKNTLAVDYREMKEQLDKWVGEDRQQQDEKSGDEEGFGTGMGRGGCCSYAHEKIEVELKSKHVGFDDKEFRQIYFGNWLRDFSQIVVPLLRRMGFKRSTLTKLVDYVGRKHFGQKIDSTTKQRLFLVDEKRLGVYRPEDHIDNPLGLEDASALDKDFYPECKEGDPCLDVDSKTWCKKYIASSGKWGTSATFVRRDLAKAYSCGRTPEGLRYFGQALHYLEDAYAHTNFIELTLIELNHKKVVPWAKKMSNGYYPLVTGVFGWMDTVSSLLIEVFQLMEKEVNCVAGKRSEGMEMFLILLEDYDYKWKQDLELILDNVEEVEKKYPRIATFSCEAVGKFVGFMRILLGYILHNIANNIDECQTAFNRGPNPDNPTHTQITKDHDDHPLHVIAAECAQELVRTVGKAMKDTWNGKMSLENLQRLACSYYFHPALKERCQEEASLGIEPVLFDTGSTVVKDSYKREGGPLDRLYHTLLLDDSLVVQIEGYTDDVGSDESNQKLSVERAKSIRNVLVNEMKVAPNQLTLVGYGENKPAVDNTSAKNRQANRRVEFRAYKPSASTDAQRRMLELITSWAGKPENKAKIERASSATWVEDQYEKLKKRISDFLAQSSEELTGDRKTLIAFYEELDKQCTSGDQEASA